MEMCMILLLFYTCIPRLFIVNVWNGKEQPVATLFKMYPFVFHRRQKNNMGLEQHEEE